MLSGSRLQILEYYPSKTQSWIHSNVLGPGFIPLNSCFRLDSSQEQRRPKHLSWIHSNVLRPGFIPLNSFFRLDSSQEKSRPKHLQVSSETNQKSPRSQDQYNREASSSFF
ncbi:hypothetical protein BT93_K2141 [Corymbia citriodora subsp. variegata]|nr:hypothetical protein BT93_K2141 [Corymbia citriodora subsp. variegata]